jgi:hypothetical protein
MTAICDAAKLPRHFLDVKSFGPIETKEKTNKNSSING